MTEAINTLDRRVWALEQQMTDVKVALTKLDVGLQANTTLTKTIAQDTGELVVLMKGLKVVGKLAGIGTAIAGFAALVSVYFKVGGQ
jgi:hypothetical protein